MPPGGESVWGAEHLICRCLLVEVGATLVAIDTGIGLADIEQPERRLGSDWMSQTNPRLDPEEALVRQVAAVGRDVHDVTDIILTHHHRDHVGGLGDLPWARVHATPECRTVVIEGGDQRLRPAQWEHGVTWAEPPTVGEPWREFETFLLPGLPETFRLVGLPGHAPGHAGVLLECAGADGSDILHVGDALFHHGQLTCTEPPAVEVFAAQTQHDAAARELTQARLADLRGVRLITAHDPTM